LASIFFVTEKGSRCDRRTGEEIPIVYPFECNLPSLEALLMALEARPRVAGQKLVYRELPDGQLLIVRRMDVTIANEDVAKIEAPRRRFVEQAVIGAVA